MDYDPNAPAFGPGSQTDDEKQTEVVSDETTAEVTKNKETETPEEESKVPYSRFKKFHEEAKRYKQEADEWKAKAEAQTSKPEPDSEIPDYWKELYGDSEASKKAWKVYQRGNQDLIAQARQEAVEAVKAEQREEAQRVENNIGYIDDQLETLNDFTGRELTEPEQSAILDIVDEYSPKDDDGNYTAMISFEKALSIYEMQQQTKKEKKIDSRNQVASLSNTKTQGQTTVNSEQDKNWNPLDWDAFKKRL